MIKLTESRKHWNTDRFKDTFLHEAEKLTVSDLMLQQGLSQSSYARESGHKLTLLSASETEDSIIIKAGIFYTGIIMGCHCADDPSPNNEVSEYCEVTLAIRKSDASTTISLINN